MLIRWFMRNKSYPSIFWNIKCLLFIFFIICTEIICTENCLAQHSLPLKSNLNQFSESDKNGYRIYPYNKKRIRLVTAANIAGYSGVLIGLNAAWYSQYPRSSFHFLMIMQNGCRLIKWGMPMEPTLAAASAMNCGDGRVCRVNKESG